MSVNLFSFRYQSNSSDKPNSNSSDTAKSKAKMKIQDNTCQSTQSKNVAKKKFNLWNFLENMKASNSVTPNDAGTRSRFRFVPKKTPATPRLNLNKMKYHVLRCFKLFVVSTIGFAFVSRCATYDRSLVSIEQFPKVNASNEKNYFGANESTNHPGAKSNQPPSQVCNNENELMDLQSKLSPLNPLSRMQSNELLEMHRMNLVIMRDPRYQYFLQQQAQQTMIQAAQLFQALQKQQQKNIQMPTMQNSSVHSPNSSPGIHHNTSMPGSQTTPPNMASSLNVGGILTPSTPSSGAHTLQIQKHPAAQRALEPSPEETTDLEELKQFANTFKQRRIKLGFSQEDVALAIANGNTIANNTISRFEALSLSTNSMCKFKPLLQKWLEDNDNLDGQISGTNALTYPLIAVKRRKKRTYIDSIDRDALEKAFMVNSKPKREEITHLADKIGMEREVVRVWFNNRRRIEKQINPPTGGVDDSPTGASTSK